MRRKIGRDTRIQKKPPMYCVKTGPPYNYTDQKKLIAETKKEMKAIEDTGVLALRKFTKPCPRTRAIWEDYDTHTGIRKADEAFLEAIKRGETFKWPE